MSRKDHLFLGGDPILENFLSLGQVIRSKYTTKYLKEKLFNEVILIEREEEEADRVSNKNIISSKQNNRGNRDSTIVGGKDPQRSSDYTYYGTIFESITSIITKLFHRLINITTQSILGRWH
jgi:hypothetical protein